MAPNFPKPAGTFKITPSVISGNTALGGRYLQYFHTGAGEATLVATTNKTASLDFYIDDAHHLSSWTSETLPPSQVNFLDQAPYRSDVPEGYELITFNLGTSGAGGFGTTHDAGTPNFYVGYDKSFSSDFDWFYLCEVNGTAPYFSLGSQVQLFWRKVGAQDCDKCAEVGLKIEQNE